MITRKTLILSLVLVLALAFVPLHALTVRTSLIVDQANHSNFNGFGMGGEITIGNANQGEKINLFPFVSVAFGKYTNDTSVRLSSDQPLKSVFAVSDYNGAYFARALLGIEISSKIHGVYCGTEMGIFARSSWFCLYRTNQSDWSRKSFLCLGAFAHVNVNIPLKNNLSLFVRVGAIGQSLFFEKLTAREKKKIQSGDYSILDKGSIGLSAGCGFSVIM